MKKVKEFIKKYIIRWIEYTVQKMAQVNSQLLGTYALHQKTFLPYKNYCKGEKDIVVCGAGPTLNKYEPIDGAIHIALNRAFLHDKVDFDFIFAQDYTGICMVEEALINYKPDTCVKFLGTQPPGKKLIPESLRLKCNALKFDTDSYINGVYGEPIVDIDSRPIANMKGVGQSVMQLALYMNPRKIYIVGCDMSGAHFSTESLDAEKQKKEKIKMENLWNTTMELQLKRWKDIKEFAKMNYPDVEIVVVNPVGLKGMFESEIEM